MLLGYSKLIKIDVNNINSFKKMISIQNLSKNHNT